MAEKDRAKHAFGSSQNLDAAIQSGKIDAFDILFLDGDTDNPKIGWVDKDGKPVILKDEKADLTEIVADVAELETQLATKVSADEVDAKISKKADTVEVDAKIGKAVTDTVANANAYTDEKLEAALGEYLAKKYEIAYKPEGTLVNYRDKEIRVMCPANTKWVKQSVGANGNVNMYYMGFKAYAPENAVSFKEDDQATIVDQTMYYFENNDFAGIDENGRKYSIVWLALASYDETADTWTYFGAKSSKDKYIGWYYSIEWYDSNGVLIASDCIRINLSNEECHSSIEPYYVSDMKKDIETIIEEKIAEVDSAYEIVEF